MDIIKKATEEEIQAFIERARKDRYAFIIKEEDEAFAHMNMRQIMRAYPCTGILVEQTHSGVAFHMTQLDNLDSILEEGLDVSDKEDNTFGDNVLYAYPTPYPFDDYMMPHAEFMVEYGPGTLRSIFTQDKDPLFQGELLIPKSKIKTVTLYRVEEE